MNTKELCAAFYKLSTPTVSDALDKLEIRGGCEGLVPVTVGKKYVGPAFTVRYEPRGIVKTKAGDYIDEVKEDNVIVIDNGGRTYCTVWGDILTTVAIAKKAAGTVIDGVCRDVDGIREMNYPMYSKGHFMVTGKDRVDCVEVGGNVSICNVQVKPGDIVMADQTGVLIIPQEKAEEVLASALKIHEAEENILSAVRAGSSLFDARQKFKYDTLQRPDRE